jgi:hypothetical protein
MPDLALAWVTQLHVKGHIVARVACSSDGFAVDEIFARVESITVARRRVFLGGHGLFPVNPAAV